MKVCLIRPPRSIYDDLYTRSSIFYPMGLGYLASYLERENFEVKIIDAFLGDFSLEEVTFQVIDYKPSVVGISFSTENRFPAIRTAKALKRSSSSFYIVGGGPHPTLAAEDLLANIPAFDMVLRGEGERYFTSLCRKINSSQNFTDLPGLSFRREGGFVHNKMGRPIKDLNRMPFPARHYYLPV